MSSAPARFARDERGVDLVEYALLLGLLALGVYGAASGIAPVFGDLVTGLVSSW